MRTFAEKPKVSQHATSALGRAHSNLQRTFENQAAPHLLEAHRANARGDSPPAGSGRLGHDFSRILVHAPPNGLPSMSVGANRGGDDGGGGTASTTSPPTPASGGASATGKSVDIFPVSLPGATRDAATDIARANTIWSQCSVGVKLSGGESWSTDLLDRLPPKGALNEYSTPTSPTQEELDLLDHHPGGKGMIHAYFVPGLSAGSRGESFWPAIAPNGVRAVVVSDSAALDTFAHELGHVLLDDGTHHSDPDNLMAPGAIRTVGVDKLDATQCKKV